jgi:hypothetical protein
MCDGSVVGTHTFGSFRLKPDAISWNTKKLRNALANGRRVRPNLGCGQNQRGIDIDDRIPGGARPLQSFLQKYRGIRSLPFWVRRWKQSPNVRRRYRTEQGICQGVQQHISVRMPAQAMSMWQRHAANLQRNASFELMRIPPITNSQAHPLFTARICVHQRKSADQIELRQFQIRRRRDLYIFGRTHNHSHLMPRPFNQ